MKSVKIAIMGMGTVGGGVYRLIEMEGERIAREKRRRVDILLSHLHLDHVMGLFPFAPRYDRAAEIHLYGAPGFAGELARLIGSSLWPVDLADDRAHILFHEVWDGKPFLLAEGAAPGRGPSRPGPPLLGGGVFWVYGRVVVVV